MPIHNFVYFLPRTKGAARHSSVLTIERGAEDAPLTLNEIRSVQGAATRIRELRQSTPNRTIIVDTACRAGRDLLCRSEPILDFGDRGLDAGFCLSQLQHLIREKIPDELAGAVDSFAEPVVRLLHSARSGGGRRPCRISDMLIAKLGTNRINASASPESVSGLTYHPLRTVPKFLAEQSKRVLGPRSRYDPAHLDRLIFRGIATLAGLCQSPFPVRDHLWLLPPQLEDNRLDGGNAPDIHAGQTSLVNDFMFGVLEGRSERSKEIKTKFPLPCQLIRYTDEFLTAIQCSAVSLFREEDDRDRYTRIHAYLNLNLEMWAWSLSDDRGTPQQIMDTSRLRPVHRTSFENMLYGRPV